MTKIEIIDDTVKYYSEDPKRRSILGHFNLCRYKGPNGNECAFQRCVVDDLSPFEGECAGSILYETKITFKQEYQGHDSEFSFWKDIQRLHDMDEFWNEKGLSNDGKTYVKTLKTRHQI